MLVLYLWITHCDFADPFHVTRIPRYIVLIPGSNIAPSTCNTPAIFCEPASHTISLPSLITTPREFASLTFNVTNMEFPPTLETCSKISSYLVIHSRSIPSSHLLSLVVTSHSLHSCFRTRSHRFMPHFRLWRNIQHAQSSQKKLKMKD